MSISEELKARVRRQAGNRCGYCLCPQHLAMGVLERAGIEGGD